MRHLQLILVAALLAAIPVSSSGAREDQPGVPFFGELPDLGPEPEPEDSPQRYAVRVLDAATGVPVSGARVSWTPERIEPGLARAYPLEAVMTDERGFAFFDAELWDKDAHWVADAPGYASDHDYGTQPPSIMWLSRGITVTTRLLNAFGEPVVGAKAQWFRGCGHAPTLRHAVSDARGHITISDIDPSLGELWIEAQGVAGEYYSLMDAVSYGDGVHDVVLSYGRTARGVVRGLAGEPVAGVVVRSLQCFRGPATTTNRDGSFTLHGVEPGELLLFSHPASLRKPWDGVACLNYEDLAWREDIPFTVTLTPLRIVVPPRDCSVQVQIDLPAEQALDIDFVHEGTGLVIETSASKDEPGQIDLFAGRWRVLPSAEFAEHTFDQTTVEAIAGKQAVVRLAGRALPRLTVNGLPTFWQQLRFAAFQSEQAHNKDGGVPWSPAIPEQGKVGVAIASRDDSPLQVFAATADGAEPRSIDIQLPEPTKIQLVGALATYQRVRLVADITGVQWQLKETKRDDLLLTHARGAAKLIFDNRGTRRVVPVQLPPQPSTLIIDLTKFPEEPLVTEAQFTILSADGSHAVGAQVREAGDDSSTRWTFKEPRGVSIGTWLEVRRNGWATLTHFVVDAQPVTLQWGTASLELHTVTQEDDDPIETTLWIRGVAYPIPESGRTLRGLPMGTHEALLSVRSPNYAYQGRRLPITLTAGSVTKVIVRLPGTD